MARTLAQAYVQIKPDTSGFGVQLKVSLQASAQQAGQAAGRQLGDALNKGASGVNFGGVVRQAAGLVAVLGPAGIAGAAVKMGIQTASALQQAQVGFATLLGSGQKAQDFLKQLSSFAAATPFELAGLVDSSRLLLGVGVNAQQVIPMLTAFGDAAGAVGVGQEAFQRIMLATSQAISAGKFQAADLNQITENGIPIYKLLAESMGKPVPEIRKLSEQGKLLASDVLPALQRQMEKDYGGAMARQSQTLAGVWSTLKDTVSIGLANSLQPLVPLLSALIPRAADLAGKALGVMSGAITAVASGFQGGDQPASAFGRALWTVGQGVQAMIQGFQSGQVSADGFVGGMMAAGAAARAVIDDVKEFANWLHSGSDAANATATAMRFIAPTVAGATTAIGGIIVATKVWTAVQTLLDIALDANPVGLIVVAIGALVGAVIYAWTHFATFRQVVMAAWDGIKTAALTAWTTVLQPTMRALVGFWQGVLVPAALWLWHTILEPAFRGIAAVATWLWTNILQPMFNGWVFVIRNFVAPVVMFLWHNVIEPAWSGIRTAIGVAWAAIQIVFGLIEIQVRAVAFIFGWLWHNIVEPYWRGMSAVIRSVWDSEIHPILTFLGNIIENDVAPKFKKGVQILSDAWSAVREAMAAPIRFTVGVVINKGIIAGWNWLHDHLKVGSHVDDVPLPFAGGGRIPGVPSSRDNRLAMVATGEYVVNARQTARHLPLLEAINAGVEGFAAGGLVGEIAGVISDPVGWLRNRIGALGSLPGAGPFRDLVADVGRNVVNLGVDAIKAVIGSVGGAISGAIAGGRAATGQLAQWIAAAMAITGVPAYWAPMLNTLIQRESGGNPRSINLTDINAQHGDPSRGLMQTIGATFNAYRLPGLSADIYDPVSNIVAGIRYILSRYGDITRVQQAHAELPPLGYARGGLVGSVMSMDSGFGVLQPGANLVLNGTGGREPISAGPVDLSDWSVSRLAQALSARPLKVVITGPDLGLTVAGVAP